MSGLGRLVATGLGAAVAAAAVNAAVAGVARAAGVDFEVSGGEAIPVSGIAFVTGVFSVTGVLIAAALRQWSEQPVRWWWRTTATLTALSLVPPFVAGADGATTATLVLLHLVAASLVIPAVARSLRTDADVASGVHHREYAAPRE